MIKMYCISCFLIYNFLDVLLYKKGMEESISDHLIEMWKRKNFDIAAFENLVNWNCKDECKYS